MPNSINNINVLIGKYTDGSLTEKEAEQLLHEVQTNPDSEATLFRNLMCDFFLREKYKGTLELQKELVGKDSFTTKNSTRVSSENTSRTLESEDDLFWPTRKNRPITTSPKMTAEEENAYRQFQKSLGKEGINTKVNDEPFDPFAIFSELEKRDRKLQIDKKTAPYHWTVSDFFFGISIIVAIVIGIGIYYENLWELERNHQVVPPVMEDCQAIATITDVVDPVWSPSSKGYRQGQKLDRSELILDSGLVALMFSNGARILLEGPVHYRINSPLDTYCCFGKISATIPPKANGFRVGTELGVIVDRGTEFWLSIQNDTLEAETVKGLIEVIGKDNLTVPLHQGNGTRLVKDEPQKLYKLKESQYIRWDTFENLLADYLTRQEKKHKDESQKINTDPNVLLRFDFTQPLSPNGTVDNLSVSGKEITTGGTIHEGHFGNWLQRDIKALWLTGQNSHVETTLSGQYTSFSITAKVKINKIKTVGSVLVASEDMNKPGAFLLQISEHGRLKILIRRSNGNMEHYESRQVITPSQCGTWAEYTVVYDTRTRQVSFFCDGKTKGTSTIKSNAPVIFDRLLIGNEKATNWNNNRVLDGAISEFRIYRLSGT